MSEQAKAPMARGRRAGSVPRVGDRAYGRDNNFNLIRMVAASSVLVSHASLIAHGQGPEPLEQALHGITLGTLGVYVFFAISGFFITRSFESRRDPAAFLWARVMRLLPGLVTVTVVTAVAGALVTTAPMGQYLPAALGYVLHNSTLISLQAHLPGVFENNPYTRSLNGSLWTLFYEVLCYMAVFVLGLLGVLHRRRLTLPLAAFFLGFYIVVIMSGVEGRTANVARLGLPFLLGAMIWIWRDRLPFSWAVAAGLALATGLIWASAPWLFMPVLVLAVGYATLLCGYADTPWLRGYNRLGDYSYGMYVYAFPIQQMMAHFGLREVLPNILAAAPLTLVCAVLSWQLVEKPAMALRRPALRRRSTVAN